MKIKPPGGDNFRIPEPPDDKKPGKAKGADFEKHVEGSPQEASKPGRSPYASSVEAKELREALKEVNKEDPGALRAVAQRVVQWAMTQRFGEGFNRLKGAKELQAAVVEDILEDPVGKSRLELLTQKL